jgi:hypothetical protein
MTSLVPPTQGRRRSPLIAWCVFILIAAFIAGCGGGAETRDTGEVGREQPQAKVNLVLKNDTATLTGRFESVDGYLSQSPKVLLSAAAGPASASFPMRVPELGFYELFAWWPQAAAQAGSAGVTVKHRGGQSTLVVDQRTMGGQWNSLGFFEFDPAAGGIIVFEKLGSTPLLVDAVRFQYAGKQRPALSMRTDKLPIGLKESRYSAQVDATGGLVPYAYSLADGSLPPGIELDGRTGLLSGQFALAGHYEFAIAVRDAAGAQAMQRLEIDVGDSAGSESSATGLMPRPGATARESPASLGSTANLGNLLNIIAQMPEGNWAKVNLNSYSSVWTPAELRPLFGSGNPTPSKIILAWSSFAWDSNRGNLLLYGGGHANYRGNDVYLWRGSTQLWERASLPSEMVQDSLGNWNAVDSADNAPASAHTYDNSLFFPLLDRLVVVGGAADSNGGHYLRKATETTSRKTGLYLFNPALADGSKVGGSTGSHVKRVAPHPEIVGGNMWSNREAWLNATSTSVPPNEAYVNGCADSAQEGGKDVAYLRTVNALYKYTINDIRDPAADTWQRVGVYWNGPGSKATCAYDGSRKTFVRTATNAVPFVYWNLNTPGPSNKDVPFAVSDPTGEFTQLLSANAILIQNCAIDFDLQRRSYALWCGDGRVWTLNPPAVLSPTGWTIGRNPSPTSAVPNGDVGTGILGKWKYIPNLDVFMGLQDPVEGNIWLYKPAGWRNPTGANLPPTVSITQPASGTSFTSGAPITVIASASDNDGSVSKVEFFNGATKINEVLSAPFSFVWSSAPTGTLALTAVATDDSGAQTTSSAVTITVNPPSDPNLPPSVAITQPVGGASFVTGDPITIAATASDSDGIVSKLEFFEGTNKIGEVTTAPYSFVWTTAPLGTLSLTAVAIDDKGAKSVSDPVSVTVAPDAAGATVVLQRGVNANNLVGDTYLSTYSQTLSFGNVNNLLDYGAHYSTLVRFAVFQSEGGPVPNGANIQSAVLSLYKYSAYDMVYGVHRVLKNWSEATATWNRADASNLWSAPGSNAAGLDYASNADATGATGFSPGWINFDVTAAVQQMSGSTPTANYGWRLRQISGYTSALKRLYSSEFASDPTLRPKLVVRFD